MTEEIKAAWLKAFDLKDVHQAAQRKFHTSELERYKLRGDLYTAVGELAAKGLNAENFWEIAKLAEQEKKDEKAADKIINANKAARNKPLKTYRSAISDAARKLAEDTCEGLQEAFETWHNQALEANNAELAFHHVEFQEFDLDDKCTNAAKEKLEGDLTQLDKRIFAKELMTCYREVQTKVKKPVINVADNKRKTERQGTGQLWGQFYKTGWKCFRQQKPKRNLWADYRRSLKALQSAVDDFNA